jgi:uncharacterized protein
VVLPVQLIVLAKEPVAGRVKTRLCPPLTPVQAAEVAAAALADTLDAVRRADVARRVLALDGTLDAPGFDVLAQRGDGLDERISAAYEDAFDGSCLPMLLIGMDTPQVTAGLLEDAAALLLHPDVDAVMGDAEDGGWWALGLHWPQPALLLGVAPSRSDTGAQQRARLAGLRVRDLPVLRDVDTVADATAVAGATSGAFARTVARLVGVTAAGVPA